MSLFMFKQYQIIELEADINPVLTVGMHGVILEVWDKETYEVEFLDEEGYNYEYEGKATFTLKASDMRV